MVYFPLAALCRVEKSHFAVSDIAKKLSGTSVGFCVDDSLLLQRIANNKYCQIWSIFHLKFPKCFFPVRHRTPGILQTALAPVPWQHTQCHSFFCN